MITIDKQKQLARDVLETTQGHIPGSIIAGGAPRNWYANKLANDIDIFCPGKNHDFKFLADELGIEITKKTKEETLDYALFVVWEAEIEEETIQWICFPDRERWQTATDFVLESFDFNICKCFFEDGNIVLTKLAQDDFDNKTLSFSMKSILKNKRSQTLHTRAEKMKNIFPDYQIMILE